MKNELLQTLNQLLDEKLKVIQNSIKNIENNQKRIENKLNSMVNQTVELPEFIRETHSRLEDIKNELTIDEVISSSNWKDIANFKTVK